MGVYDELNKNLLKQAHNRQGALRSGIDHNQPLEDAIERINNTASFNDKVRGVPIDIDTVVYEIIGVCAIHGSNKEAVKLVREIVQRLVGPKL